MDYIPPHKRKKVVWLRCGLQWCTLQYAVLYDVQIMQYDVVCDVRMKTPIFRGLVRFQCCSLVQREDRELRCKAPDNLHKKINRRKNKQKKNKKYKRSLHRKQKKYTKEIFLENNNGEERRNKKNFRQSSQKLQAKSTQIYIKE